MYYYVLTTVELYRKLNFQKENINNTTISYNSNIRYLEAAVGNQLHSPRSMNAHY